MPVQWIPGDPVFANSYLVGDVLIDAGVTPLALSKYRDRIRNIILTHCHFDHTAYVREIALMTRATVYIHQDDASGLVEDAKSLSMHFASHSPGMVADSLLRDGDHVGDLLIIHTPGHTPGSICILDEATGDLISGDTVFTDGGFGRFDFPGGSLEELVRSIERLSALDIQGLYPGHGEPCRQGGGRHIAAARELIRMTCH
jgi:hydroxyacylglutathione hydrolase